MTTDEEIVKESYKIIGTPEDMQDRSRLYCCREARASERQQMAFAIESGCLSYIPRRLKSKHEEQLSGEAYKHGVKAALSIVKKPDLPEMFDWNKITEDIKVETYKQTIKMLKKMLKESKGYNHKNSKDWNRGFDYGANNTLVIAISNLEKMI